MIEITYELYHNHQNHLNLHNHHCDKCQSIIKITYPDTDYIKKISVNDDELDVICKNKYLSNMLKTQEECSICLERLCFSKNKHVNNNPDNKLCGLVKLILECFMSYCIENNDQTNQNNQSDHLITTNNEICVISCYHIFHTKCISDWIKNDKSCPLCRKKLDVIK
jgi:hypothetical protein